MKKISDLPSGAYCFTGVKKDGIGHSKVVTRRLVQSASGGDALAEIEGRVEGVERHHALRPIHRGRERQPDARDDAVGAPGVQNFVDGFAFVKDQPRLRLHGDDFQRAHGIEVAQIAIARPSRCRPIRRREIRRAKL